MTDYLKKYSISAVLASVIFLYFFFGIQHIGKFVTADEHYWVYERIPQYWNAIEQGKWQKTFINDKPGVTLALVSGIALFSEPHPENHFYENYDRTLVYDVSHTKALYSAFRLPILFVNALLLIYLFWIISRLTNKFIALWTIVFAALSPILLGISQIINPDALLWSFCAAALLSYYAFLKFKEYKFLLATIFFTGFALLTKYIAVILLPFYLALIVFQFFANSDTKKKEIIFVLKKDILYWIIISIGSATLFCIFLPAIFFDSKYINTFLITVPDKKQLAIIGGSIMMLLFIDTFLMSNKLFFLIKKTVFHTEMQIRFLSFFFLILFVGLIIIRNFFPNWDIFTLIPFDIKDLSNARYYTDIPNFFEAFLIEWNPVIFSLTPISLIGIVALFIIYTGKNKKRHSFLVYSILFFFLAYTILLIYSNVLTTPRYSIMLYPFFAFLAALGFWYVTEKISWPYAKFAATAIILIASLASLIAISPFYFNYTNLFLPKSLLISDAWGYGGYEAAQHLNGLPKAENLTIWSDYYGVCEFFIGKCLTAYIFDPQIIKPDYYVLTRRGQIRYMSRADRWERISGLTAYKYYNASNTEWQLFIGNRPGNFVKVVKVNNKK